MMSGIMALKQPLSKEMKDLITRSITQQYAAAGLTGSPGIMQEAIAEALAKAEIPLFEEAQRAYFAGLGLPGTQQIQTASATVQPSGGNPFQALMDWYKAKNPPTTTTTPSFSNWQAGPPTEQMGP
jgi:hypothetical protein